MARMHRLSQVLVGQSLSQLMAGLRFRRTEANVLRANEAPKRRHIYVKITSLLHMAQPVL